MDCERYQDLSQLGWFGSARQPWVAAEATAPMDAILHSENGPAGLAYETCMDYNVNDVNGQFYTMTRTNSMEEVKAVTAPMEVVPMRQHEAFQVRDFVKAESEDEDFVKTECEDVAANEELAEDVGQKVDPDLLHTDSELLLFDSPDLLSEIGDRDLIDYIVSDVSVRSHFSLKRNYISNSLN